MIRRLFSLLFVCLFALPVLGQDAGDPAAADEGFSLSVNMGDAATSGDWTMAIQLILVMTLLSLAPMLLVMCTCFVRIVIVLSFARQAMGTQNAPPNQVLLGLAVLLTAFIMQPVWEQINEDAIAPFRADEINSGEAWVRGSEHIKQFMLSQTRVEDFNYVASLQREPLVDGEPKFTVVVASYVMSELRTAFQMGILIYLPFIIIDFVVASVLMSLGMMMMPPVMISLPCKLLLFVLVDGWRLLIDGLVRSFGLF